MDTWNENITLLISKVAEVLDILIEMSTASDTEDHDNEIVSQYLARYAQQVGQIALTAETSSFVGLYNVCLFYQAILESLAHDDTSIGSDVQILLEEWPTLVMAYIEAPGDIETGKALVAHLQSPTWRMPLSEDDVIVLQELILSQTVAEPDPEVPEEPTVAPFGTSTISSFEDEIEPAHLKQVEMPQATENLSSMDTNHVVELDETGRELIELLRLEVDELAQMLDNLPADIDAEAWQEFLRDHAEILERLGDGAETVGLSGLQHAITYIRLNLLNIAALETPPTESQRQVIMAWPGPVRQYLQAFNDPVTHTALLEHLQDSRWPQPICSTDYTELTAALVVSGINTGSEHQEPRQRHAQLADISLVLPNDVNPELLDSLLQDLPQQTADFSAAVQRLTDGTGSLADVDAAQRVAHTLKGAANTVGVPGVANLTHHLEDILITLAKHQAMPTPMISQSLTTAADCLEAMSEALIGISEMPPAEETLGVLQDIMDWANMIDASGIPADDTRPPVRVILPGLANQAPTQTDDATSSNNATAAVSGARMTTDLVDELLRLAGEAMILNGQLNDRLSRTVQQVQTVRTQNNILQQLVLELEHLVDIRGLASPVLQHAPQGEFDPLEMEQYNELHTVSRRLLEAVMDSRALEQDVIASLSIMNDLLTEQQKVQRENEDAVMHTRMVPVKTIIPRLQRSVRQACRLTGKDVELSFYGSDTLMDNNVLNNLIDPMMHLLRNAIDHGIESPEERECIGKPSAGNIALEFAREGNTVVVRCRDDGAGLNYAAIRYTAIERGLIQENQQLSEDELGRLILQPGFSTRSQSTQISGRGIGMDAVYDRVQLLKGSLHLTSKTNEGCLIELRLPVTLMSTHGLLVRCGKETFAISDRGIEQILYPAAGELGQVGSKLTYQLDDNIYEAARLQDLLNTASEPQSQPEMQPALLVREESGKHRVVLTQEVLDSQTLVVKNLGAYVPSLKGIIGATILGDGRVAAVIDLPELLRNPVRMTSESTSSQAGATPARVNMPIALVVDDSLTARRALADFVSDLGFEVHTATDGLEAVALMDQQVPDILLTDLEMPRMNGLELIAHVRSHDKTKHIPVILITSRSTEKHRQSATRAGANAYMVKPFAEDALATYIHEFTAQRGVA